MLRKRFPACAALLAVAHLVTSIGCTSGAFRQAVAPSQESIVLPSAKAHTDAPSDELQRLPSDNEFAVAPAQSNAPITAGVNYDDVAVDVDEVVRAQDYPNGPLKEFFFNPYVIGAAIVAAIALPLALDDGGPPIQAGP